MSLENEYLEHLLSVWQEVDPKFKSAKRILLLSDYDGTLTPIVECPEMAELSEETRSLLKMLARQRRIKVGIISGRALADLKHKVDIDGIIYAGNHGLEIEGPGVSFINPLAEEMKPVIRIMHHVLSKTLSGIKGVLVEDKGLTLSVHYRNVEEEKKDEVASTFGRVVEVVEASGKVKVTSGKKVYELRPAVSWDKGKAIKLLMKKYGKGGRESGLLAVYLGDDRTDEDGFAVIEKYQNGLSVYVGEERQDSQAGYYLKSTEEVKTFLALLLEQ